ncbi:MAG: hypothetical protein EHM64_15580, partial [Ignavibacteriae bacterium]
MIKSSVCALALLIVSSTPVFSQIYVAPNGSDLNPGTIEQPLESLQKAQELAGSGDTVYVRGGIYNVRQDQISKVVSSLFACVTYLDKSGTEGQSIKYWAYPGERPIFDFSAVKPANERVAGIYVVGSYIHIKGLEMTGVQVTITAHTESYCIYSKGNHNIFEQISMHDNVGTGLRHYTGGDNLFLNCDSYRNRDNVSEDKVGSNTDGFGCHPNSSGAGNIFRGCRSWFNSDDGFDIIRSGAAVVFDSCWSFYNGYSTSFQKLGDGNGFKAGGYAYDPASKIPNPVPNNTIEFCIAVGNKANGFYSNHHLNGNSWYNNTAYKNDINFNMVNRESPEADSSIWAFGYHHVLENNLSYKAGSSDTAYIDTSKSTLSHNSFDSGFNLTDQDFVSLDESQLTAPRKPDGSLPYIDFMKPAAGSKLIDAGGDIGFPFAGRAPDIGALETDEPTVVESLKNIAPDNMVLHQNYPNPFNPVTTIVYEIPFSANVQLSI